VISSKIAESTRRTALLTLIFLSRYAGAANPAPDAQAQARQLLVPVRAAPTTTESYPRENLDAEPVFDAQAHSRRLLSGAPLQDRPREQPSVKRAPSAAVEPRLDAQALARKMILSTRDEPASSRVRSDGIRVDSEVARRAGAGVTPSR
jgi:hypothetical protein